MSSSPIRASLSVPPRATEPVPLSLRGNFTDVPIRRTLVAMTLPSAIGGICFLGIFVTDAYFVGQLGTEKQAILGFLFPVLIGLMYLAIGFGVGGGAVVGRMLGAGDREAARRVATNTLALSQLSLGALWGLGAGFGGSAFGLLGAPASFLPEVEAYLTVSMGAMFVMNLGVTGGAILRADGDAGTPAVAMLLCALVNLLLDPLLIFGLGPVPALGVVGAAWATAAGAVVGSAITVVALYRQGLLTLPAAALRHWREDFVRVSTIAAPAAGVQLLTPLTLLVVTWMISPLGETAVAAFAVGTRMELLAMVPLIALSTTLSSFVAQNWSAGEHARVRHALMASLHFSCIWGLLLVLVMRWAGPDIVSAFSDEHAVTEALALYGVWVVPTAGFVGLVNLVYGSLNAVHQPLAATALCLGRVFVCYLPAAWLGSLWLGLEGLFIGIASGNAASGVATYVSARRVLARNGGTTRSVERV